MGGRLKDRVALVTGAGLGIGRAIALRFAAEGAKVIVGTRTAKDGEDTVAAIKKSGGAATLVAADVGTRAACTQLVTETKRIYGGLDILLHNAAYCPYARIEDLTDDDLERTFTVNLKACFWLTQAALPLLRASKAPRILITSSISGNNASAKGLVHYSTSKAGVTGFVRNLALELAKDKITVNAVEPGLIKTERSGQMTDFMKTAAKRTPLGRVGEGDDIAGAMVFLASDDAAFLTGQSLLVDGGIALPSSLDIEAVTDA